MGKLTVTYLDASNEFSNFGVNTPDLNAGNFNAVSAKMDALVTAVDGVTLGTKTRDARLAVTANFPAVLPNDQNAQRETKWLVRATDNVNGRAVTFEIPCADLSLLTPGTGNMNLASPAGAALVTAVEDLVLSIDGNPITVIAIKHVGRKL